MVELTRVLLVPAVDHGLAEIASGSATFAASGVQLVIIGGARVIGCEVGQGGRWTVAPSSVRLSNVAVVVCLLVHFKWVELKIELVSLRLCLHHI